jgi:hypothetical protein
MLSQVNVIIRLILSLLVWPKVITLSGFYCIEFLFVHSTFQVLKHQLQTQEQTLGMYNDEVINNNLLKYEQKTMKKYDLLTLKDS